MLQPAEMLPITTFPADPEPRVRDLDLAERLGFGDPHKVRTLIERNIAELEALGAVSRRANGISADMAEINLPQGGAKSTRRRGRPGTTYFLNEPQALLICIFSRTATAVQVRRVLIETFIAFRRGRASPATAQPSRPARIGAASRQRANQVRHAKLQLAAAAGRLDELGVDVRAIDLAVVLDFSRSFLAARPRLSAAR